jgi:tetratricopeptide (TPR) repeat protein
MRPDTLPPLFGLLVLVQVFMIFSVIGVISLILTATNENRANSSEVHDVQARPPRVANFDEARQLYLQKANLLLANGKQAEAGANYIELGEITQVHGLLPAAEAIYKKGIGLLKRSEQPNDPRLVIALDDLGWLYITWGRVLDGARLLDQARSKADLVQPDDPRLIRHLDTQAAYLLVEGKYSEAEKSWTQALDIGKMNYGPDSPEYDSILVHYGQGSEIMGDYKNAEQLFQRYLAIEDRQPPAEPSARAVAAGELARIYTELHKYSQAQSWFNTATSIMNLDPDHAPLARSIILSYLGDYYMAQGEWFKAQAPYRDALSIQQKVLGDNRAVAASMMSLSNALKKLHLKDEAKDLVKRAQAILSVQQKQNPLADETVDVMALRRP